MTRLQDKYDVRIHFPPDRHSSEAGQVSVRGSKKGVADARAEILELIEYESENSHTEELRVPSKAVPRLLGRSGATINQLRLDTGAQVDLERKDGGGKLRLRGSRAAVDAARAAVEAIVEQVESETTITLQIPARFHGTLIGSGGKHLREIITRAGGPEDSRTQAQFVRFPRSTEAQDQVTVRGPRELAAKIAAELEGEAKQLMDRVVYGAAVPGALHRQLITRGGTRQSEWQTQHQVGIVLPHWREYAEIGAPANADTLADVGDTPVVKVTGPEDGVRTVLAEIQALVAAEKSRKQRASAARIDQDA